MQATVPKGRRHLAAGGAPRCSTRLCRASESYPSDSAVAQSSVSEAARRGFLFSERRQAGSVFRLKACKIVAGGKAAQRPPPPDGVPTIPITLTG